MGMRTMSARQHWIPSRIVIRVAPAVGRHGPLHNEVQESQGLFGNLGTIFMFKFGFCTG